MEKLRQIASQRAPVWVAARRNRRISYAQSGEDLIIDHLLGWIGAPRRTYVDIGAHHPTLFSNTYRFYRAGHQGVLVEADPELARELGRRRPRDTVLNVGISGETDGSAEFYVMHPRTLNTFSEREVRAYMQHYADARVDYTVPVELLPINELLRRSPQELDILSIDVEGMDLEIAEALDLERYRPKVICIETAEYGGDMRIKKPRRIIDVLGSANYMFYADTFANSIFCDLTLFERVAVPEPIPLIRPDGG